MYCNSLISCCVFLRVFCMCVCFRALHVAVLGACSASPSAHGSCTISAERATAAGILSRHSPAACSSVGSNVWQTQNPGAYLILSFSTLAREKRGEWWGRNECQCMRVCVCMCLSRDLRGTAVCRELTHCHTHQYNCAEKKAGRMSRAERQRHKHTHGEKGQGVYLRFRRNLIRKKELIEKKN